MTVEQGRDPVNKASDNHNAIRLALAGFRKAGKQVSDATEVLFRGAINIIGPVINDISVLAIKAHGPTSDHLGIHAYARTKSLMQKIPWVASRDDASPTTTAKFFKYFTGADPSRIYQYIAAFAGTGLAAKAAERLIGGVSDDMALQLAALCPQIEQPHVVVMGLTSMLLLHAYHLVQATRAEQTGVLADRQLARLQSVLRMERSAEQGGLAGLQTSAVEARSKYNADFQARYISEHGLMKIGIMRRERTQPEGIVGALAEPDRSLVINITKLLEESYALSNRESHLTGLGLLLELQDATLVRNLLEGRRVPEDMASKYGIDKNMLIGSARRHERSFDTANAFARFYSRVDSVYGTSKQSASSKLG